MRYIFPEYIAYADFEDASYELQKVCLNLQHSSIYFTNLEKFFKNKEVEKANEYRKMVLQYINQIFLFSNSAGYIINSYMKWLSGLSEGPFLHNEKYHTCAHSVMLDRVERFIIQYCENFPTEYSVECRTVSFFYHAQIYNGRVSNLQIKPHLELLNSDGAWQEFCEGSQNQESSLKKMVELSQSFRGEFEHEKAGEISLRALWSLVEIERSRLHIESKRLGDEETSINIETVPFDASMGRMADPLISKYQIARKVHLADSSMGPYKKDWPAPIEAGRGNKPDLFAWNFEMYVKLKEQFPDKFPEEYDPNLFSNFEN